MKNSNQKGVIHLLPLLIVVAAVGVISFLLIASTAPINNGLFGVLFPKPQSHAATGPTIFIDPTNVLHNSSSYVLGTNRNHVSANWSFPNGLAKLNKMKELTPTWGGGKYMYRIGHGITDGRTDWNYKGYHFEQKFGPNTSYPFDINASYPYDDLRNPLSDAMTMGADPINVINYGSSTPDEAARYVSFLDKNSDPNRSLHPYPQSWVGQSRLFEMGNEISWNHELGHYAYANTETQYAQRGKLFAQAMRANSDVPIQIGMVASTNSSWTGSQYWSNSSTDIIKNILTNMGSDVDFLIFHGYPSWPVKLDDSINQKPSRMAQAVWSRLKIEREIRPAIDQYKPAGKDIWLADTEQHTEINPDNRGMFGAMYLADSVMTAMVEDIRVVIAFGFSHGEYLDSMFFFNDDPSNVTANFKFQKMLAQHWGDQIVKTTDQNISTYTLPGVKEPSVPNGPSNTPPLQVPYLSHAAAIKGDKLYLMVLNRTNDHDVATTISPGFNPSSVTAYELTGPNGWDSTNGDVATINNPSLTNYNFKKASITIFEISGLTGSPPPSPSSQPSPSISTSPSPSPSPSLPPSPSPSPSIVPSPSTNPNFIPTITPVVSCIPSGGTTNTVVNITWTNPPGQQPVSFVDISANPSFYPAYHKGVSGTLTTAADGFNGYSGATGALSLNPDTPYYVRLYNSNHSQPASFSRPSCTGSSPSPSPSLPPPPSPSPSPSASVFSGSVVTITAAGQSGVFNGVTVSPTMILQIAGVNTQTWNNVGGDGQHNQYLSFTYTTPNKLTHDQLKVRFVNDQFDPAAGQDVNLFVKSLNLDGIDYPTNSSTVFSSGAWTPRTGCSTGFKQSIELYCNGFFQY